MDLSTVSMGELVLLVFTLTGAIISSVPAYLYLRAWWRIRKWAEADNVNRRLARNDFLDEVFRLWILLSAILLTVVAMFVPPAIRESNRTLAEIAGWVIASWDTISISFSFLSYTDRKANLRDLARLTSGDTGKTVTVSIPGTTALVTLTAIDTPAEKGEKEDMNAN